MIKTVIVEDEIQIAEQLKRYLERYAKANELSFQITMYQNPELFLTEYQSGIDIVFMDINMPQMNGMVAAQKLRKVDGDVNLVFVTFLAKYAVNGYEVNALDFILKPVQYPFFEKKMERILQTMKKDDHKKIMVKTSDGVVAVRVNDIHYIEIVEHYLYFHLDNEVLKSRGTLKEVQQILDGEWFDLCNKCYLVNLTHVDSIIDNCVIVDGEQLAISRLRKKDFMIRLSEYYSGRKVNMGKLQ